MNTLTKLKPLNLLGVCVDAKQDMDIDMLICLQSHCHQSFSNFIRISKKCDTTVPVSGAHAAYICTSYGMNRV